MQCDEKKQICLNYAANVPEWQLDMALQAVADIGAACGALGKVQKAVAGYMAWLRALPELWAPLCTRWRSFWLSQTNSDLQKGWLLRQKPLTTHLMRH